MTFNQTSLYISSTSGTRRTIPLKFGNIFGFARCFSLTPFLSNHDSKLSKDLEKSTDSVHEVEDEEEVDKEESTYFGSPIPSEYIFSKDKPYHVRVMLHQLFTTTFDKQVISSISKNTYTVFIRVKYDVNSYFMAGNQFGFTYNNGNDIIALKDVIIKRLERYFEDYKLTDDDIIYVEASF